MITCESLEFISYLEGEDYDGEAARHIETCQDCRKRLHLYERLLEGLVASRQFQETGCVKKKETLDAALAGAEQSDVHLAGCEACASLHSAVKDAVAELDRKVAESEDTLPGSLSERVAARKRKWLEGRLDKVFDFQGVKDEKERKVRIRKLLEEEAESLPKAAFPEDLTGEKDDDSENP